MGEAKLKRTKTNHEMPQVRDMSRAEISFIQEAIKAAPPVTAGKHDVAKVGILPSGLSFIQDTDYAYYQLPAQLNGWARQIVPLGLHRVITFPCAIEFGYVGSRPFAEFVI